MTDGSSSGPTVSIVTPSFNQGRFLAATIDSVLAQDYSAIEYLVMDATSTDETLDVLRGYGDRVRWTSEADTGQAEAIDKGFRQTTGEIVAWLNSDDLYLPGAVSRAVAALLEFPAVAGVYGEAEFVGADGRVIGPCAHVQPFDLERLVNVLDFIVQPATFFRRTAYEAAGGLDRSLRYSLDYDLWIRMGRTAPLRFIAHPFAQVRIHPATKTASGGLPRLIEIEQMIRRHGRSLLPVDFQREMLLASSGAIISAARGHRWREAASLAPNVVRYAPLVTARRVARTIRHLK